jgi:hypothetical protein
MNMLVCVHACVCESALVCYMVELCTYRFIDVLCYMYIIMICRGMHNLVHQWYIMIYHL